MNDPFATETAEHEAAPAASNFFDSGAASCRFNNIGDSHFGTILDFKELQQRDIKTGEPSAWPDGNPKMMLVVTLQTNERDDEIDDDDGQRRLYINKPSGMFAAIASAIKASKGKFAIGGTLAVKYTGNGKPKTPGFNPSKEYAAKYIPPGTPAPADTNSNGAAGGQHTPAAAASRPPFMPPAKVAPALPAADTAKREAWEAFKASLPGSPVAGIQADFREAVKNYQPGKPPELWSIEEWKRFVADEFIRRVPNPIGKESVFAESDIPF